MRWIGWKGLLLFVAAAGCAGADIYTDKELKNKTGLPFYMAKPYLLVKRTGGTTQPVSVEVIYLPDLEHPLYAAQRVGIGKAKMTVSLEDGMLKDFTADADSKAAEFTGALTAGLKSIAEAVKIQREAEAIAAETRVMQERHAAAAELEGIADRISEAAEEGPEDVERMVTATAKRLSGELRTEAAKLKDPALRGNEVQVATALETRLRELERLQAPDALRRDLDRVIRRLRGAARRAMREATFELYEFRMKDGQTTLVRVAEPRSE
jgi:hypothetical protein